MVLGDGEAYAGGGIKGQTLHCGRTAGALRAHVSKTTRRRWREETSSNTCGCSNTTEQSDSLMSEIPRENAFRPTIGIVGNKVRGMG